METEIPTTKLDASHLIENITARNDNSSNKILSGMVMADESEVVKSSTDVPSEEPLRKIPCPMCTEQFNSMSKLDVHLKTHPEPEKYICPICASSFSKRYSISQHMLIHAEIRNFPCDKCDKSFKRKGDLVQHSKIHSGNYSNLF